MANRTLLYTTVNSRTLTDDKTYRITLNEDGSANLSELPDDLRRQWQKHGLSGRGLGHAMPNDGKHFFKVLLARVNFYFRVREEETREDSSSPPAPLT